MRDIDLMIFDFDGTLVSTGCDLVLSVNHTLQELGLKQIPEPEIISFVGDGVNKLIERALGNSNLQHYEQAMKIFGDYYGRHLLDHTVLYPGVEEILKYYNRKNKIILTNKRQEFTLDICKGLDIGKYFTQIIGDGTLPYKKPDKRLIETILHNTAMVKEKTVIIGDGINDIILAKHSGITSCVCLNGLGCRQNLLSASADYYVENILEIKLFFN